MALFGSRCEPHNDTVQKEPNHRPSPSGFRWEHTVQTLQLSFPPSHHITHPKQPPPAVEMSRCHGMVCASLFEKK